MARRRKDDFIDDGRVIADMSVDGMPGSFLRRKRRPPTPYDTERDKTEKVKLTRKERVSVYGGAITAYALFGLLIFGAFGLFIWLWLK